MPRKKREELDEDSFLDEEIADDEDELEEAPPDDDDDVGEDADEDAESSEPEIDGEDASAEAEPAEEEEEEIDYPPDDKKAVAALEKLRVRLDVSEKGNVWRVIFDDSNGRDPALLLLNGLPALKELWLLGTRVTSEAAAQYKEDHPKVTVYY